MSEIIKNISESTILLTGATGFVGRLLLEKIFRTSPNVKKIYILIRLKNHGNIEERIKKIINRKSFDTVKSQYPNFWEKIVGIEGDCSSTNLGLNDQDRQILLNEVNIVIHCAANINFEQTLKMAALVNVKGTIEMLNLAENMKKLKCFIYVSTAYSNCIKKNIDEKFYKPPLLPKNLLNLIDNLDEKILNAITPTLLDNFPNTYVYTKAIAESAVNAFNGKFPIAIVRPSIVVSTLNEPLPGYIDSFFGVTSALGACFLGVLHIIHMDKNVASDWIPADLVVNCLLAVTAKTINQSDKSISIYNCVSGAQNRITHKKMHESLAFNSQKYPSINRFWHGFVLMISNNTIYKIADFFLHLLPAYVIHFVFYCLGRKPNFINVYYKLQKLEQLLTHFIINEWYFTNNNVQNLWKNLNEIDQKLFNFDANSINWNKYMENFILGLRHHLFNESPDTLEQARRRNNYLIVIHYMTIFLLFALIIYGIHFIFR